MSKACRSKCNTSIFLSTVSVCVCVPLLKSSWATNGSFCCITGGCSFLGWRGIGLKQYVEFSCKVGNGLHGLRGQCVFCSWQSTETQERIPDAVSQGKSARELAASLSGGDEGYQCQRDLPLAPGRKRKLVQHWQSTCLVFFFFSDILLVLRLLRFFHEPFGHLYIHFFFRTPGESELRALICNLQTGEQDCRRSQKPCNSVPQVGLLRAAILRL